MKRAALPPLILAVCMVATLASARPQVVVELFTAQGCSSCLKANAEIAKMADQKGLIALTWNVDYWDYLGWKDTFAQAAFADRQRAYDKRFDLQGVYTPQVIVAGAAEASGDKAGAIEALIANARRATADPPQMILREDGRIAIGSAARRHKGSGVADDVWLIRYDPRELNVEVKEGDNKGKTVVHRDVVRQLARLGGWKGRPAIYTLPPASEEGLASLILIQGADGGRIDAALPLVAKP